MATRGRRPARTGQMRRGVLVRRAVVTVVAGALIIAAELAATLSPAALHPQSRQRLKAIVRPTSGGPESGEPVLRSTSSVPRPARSAAVHVRARLRTLEPSRSGNHAGGRCDRARARNARAWRQAGYHERRKCRGVCEDRPNWERLRDSLHWASARWGESMLARDVDLRTVRGREPGRISILSRLRRGASGDAAGTSGAQGGDSLVLRRHRLDRAG
jgi:hypothetical protein